ncbi:MAG TPA: 4-hydroxy-tetrahydrodipicolinate reductase [bacterium]|nr:4-hydroxy-tetrahydrodipicolinate reductase [bacterium]
MVRVMVCGAYGRMGQEVIKALSEQKDMMIVGAIDVRGIGESVFGITVRDNLEEVIKETRPSAIVDFTKREAALEDIKTGVKNNVTMIVGTTGFTQEDLDNLKAFVDANNGRVLIAPNFAIGAVLMIKCAELAAPFMDNVEIIELHHDGKLDSPSGTSIATAKAISEKKKFEPSLHSSEARGKTVSGINIHSVRLPGFVAHQEVIFGTLGQTLTIRHDSTSRESFMPGVIYALRNMDRIKGLVYGLDKLLFPEGLVM